MPAYVRLGTTSTDRAAAYRSLLREALPNEDLQTIRDYLQQQHAWVRVISAPWSKPRPSDSPASGPLIDPAAIHRLGK